MSNEEVMIPKSYHDKVCEEIIRFKDKQFYDAVHLLDDGTLEITVGDYTKVKRVLVEDGNNFGNLFYEDKADRPQGEWIPCSERLPEDLEVVNITWINHRPATYYADIKGKPFTATAIHYKDKWWWYSPICEDLLAEYGKSECNKMDADIEVTAWMPLPKPWKGADDESS